MDEILSRLLAEAVVLALQPLLVWLVQELRARYARAA
jgi:hypothetical protein